jgi:hypothetical protein
MKRMLRMSILAIAVVSATAPLSLLAKTSVNQSITINADDEAERASSVNGNVRLNDGVNVSSVSNVNGNIAIGAQVVAQSIENVNGNISAGAALDVTGEVNNVNGDIALGANTTIGGELSTVNGNIDCPSGNFGKGLETVNGNVQLGSVQMLGQLQTVWGDVTLNGAQINGGIRVIKPKQNGWNNYKQPSPPVIVLGPGTQVKGEILLEHPAQIYAHQSVVLPAIVGQMQAPVIRFNGAAPVSN